MLKLENWNIWSFPEFLSVSASKSMLISQSVAWNVYAVEGHSDCRDATYIFALEKAELLWPSRCKNKLVLQKDR